MKRLFAIILALCMLLSLAACGGGGNQEETTENNSGESISDVAKPQKSGGDLIIATDINMGSFFNPYSQGTLIEYGWPCYEPLAQLKADGNWYPCLAESWTVDPDTASMTVTLKKGITFHNGDSLDGDDLLFTLQSRLDYGTGSAIGSPLSVEKVDDYTVRVVWEDFSADFEAWLLKEYVYSKTAVEENGLDWILNNMVGTGPYVMQEFIPGVRLVFAANDNYWGENGAKLDTITFEYFGEETTKLAAFLNGEVHTMTTTAATSITQLDAAGYVGNTDYNTNNIENYHCHITCLDENDPLANVTVRQALYLYGIDWDYVAEACTGGLGYHTDAIGSDDMNYYKEDLERSEYNVEKAKQMLAEAGYPDGFETVIYIYPGMEKMGTLIQADLEALNITATVETVDGSVSWDYMLGGVEGVMSGIFPEQMNYDSSFQTDRFIKFHSPSGYAAGHTIWTDEGLDLWTAVTTAATIDEQNAALYDFVEYYVYTDCTFWPGYIVQGRMYCQEGVHFSDMAPIVGAGYDSSEVWIDAE